jgi:glycogen synthase
MRILVLSNLYPPHYIGGYELRCRDVTEALRERGHEVRVLTSNHKTSSKVVDEKTDYPVDRTLRLHGFFGHPWLGIRSLQGLERHNNRELLKAIREFKPDLVHVWNMGGISKSLVLTLQRTDIPTVFDVSDHWIARSLKGDVWLDWWNRSQHSLPARAQRGLWHLDGRRGKWQEEAPTNPLRHIDFQRVYFCSARLRDITADAGYDVAHGDVIHCPVNIDHFHGPVRDPHVPVKKLLYVGRLSEDKGVFTALKAMRAARTHFNGTLSIYGSGDPEYVAKLRTYAGEHDLPVSFRHATPAGMPQVYRDHDALLFTSEWEEPFALTPLEAMASGLPVIGTTTGGSAELLRHEENALTYEAGDFNDLAGQIRRLALSPVLASRLSATGQAEVRARYPLPVIVDQIERYLAETLKVWRSVSLPHYLAA